MTTAVRREPYPRPWSAADLAAARRLGVFAGRALTVTNGRLVDAGSGSPVLLTRDEYQSLWGVVFQSHQRVQLIRGVVLMESPMNPPHALGISLLMAALGGVFRTGYYVRPQMPIDFGLYTEPHPYVAVVVGSPRDYAIDHPRTAELVVEVSETSLFDDTTWKAELYAEGGVRDYWVLDLVNRQLLVLRDPAPVAAGGHAYRTQATLGPADSVSSLAAPTASVRVADLLP